VPLLPIVSLLEAPLVSLCTDRIFVEGQGPAKKADALACTSRTGGNAALRKQRASVVKQRLLRKTAFGLNK
jgi:hypothetical protein